MLQPEFDTTTLAGLWLLHDAWLDRETRHDQRSARNAVLAAAKVWDSKGTVDAGDVFPLLDPRSRMTQEERDWFERERVLAIFRALPRGPDGNELYAIHRGNPG